jgi:hypothetical protein
VAAGCLVFDLSSTLTLYAYGLDDTIYLPGLNGPQDTVRVDLVVFAPRSVNQADNNGSNKWSSGANMILTPAALGSLSQHPGVFVLIVLSLLMVFALSRF